MKPILKVGKVELIIGTDVCVTGDKFHILTDSAWEQLVEVFKPSIRHTRAGPKRKQLSFFEGCYEFDFVSR